MANIDDFTADDYLIEMYYMNQKEAELIEKDHGVTNFSSSESLLKYWRDEKPEFVGKFMEACLRKEIDIHDLNIVYIYRDIDAISIELPDHSNFEISVGSINNRARYLEFLNMIDKCVIDPSFVNYTEGPFYPREVNYGPISDEFIAKELLFNYDGSKIFDYSKLAVFMSRFEGTPYEYIDIPDKKIAESANEMMSSIGMDNEEKNKYRHKLEALIMVGEEDYDLGDFIKAFPAAALEVLKNADPNWDCEKCCQVLRNINDIAYDISDVTLATKAELLVRSNSYRESEFSNIDEQIHLIENTIGEMRKNIDFALMKKNSMRYNESVYTHNEFLADAISMMGPENIKKQIDLYLKYNIYEEKYPISIYQMSVVNAFSKNDDTINAIKEADVKFGSEMYMNFIMLTSEQLGVNSLKDLVECGNQEIKRMKEPEYDPNDNMIWTCNKEFMKTRFTRELKIDAIADAIEYQLRTFDICESDEKKVDNLLSMTRTFISELRDLGIDEKANLIQAAMAKQVYATKEDMDEVNISNSRVIECFMHGKSKYLSAEDIKDAIDGFDTEEKEKVARLYSCKGEDRKEFHINNAVDNEIFSIIINDDDIDDAVKHTMRCSPAYLSVFRESVEPEIIQGIKERLRDYEGIKDIVEVFSSKKSEQEDLSRLADIMKNEMKEEQYIHKMCEVDFENEFV